MDANSLPRVKMPNRDNFVVWDPNKIEYDPIRMDDASSSSSSATSSILSTIQSIIGRPPTGSSGFGIVVGQRPQPRRVPGGEEERLHAATTAAAATARRAPGARRAR